MCVSNERGPDGEINIPSFMGTSPPPPTVYTSANVHWRGVACLGCHPCFAKRMHWSQQTPSSNNTRDDSIHGHHQMVNTEIRLIIFSAAENEAALNSQQKQNLELAVAQIISSLLPNAGSN